MPTKKCSYTTSGIKLPSNEKAPREPEKAWPSNFWSCAVFHFACCHRGGMVMTLLGRAYSRLPQNASSTIFVTNDHADAMMLAGSIAVLRDAAIVQGAPSKERICETRKRVCRSLCRHGEYRRLWASLLTVAVGRDRKLYASVPGALCQAEGYRA
jgi:hypothetical protein